MHKIDTTMSRISEFPTKDLNIILLKLNSTIDKLNVNFDNRAAIPSNSDFGY